MFYDLNERVPESIDADTFTINGIPYQIGPISKSIYDRVMNTEPVGDIIEFWKPIITRLLKESNDRTPNLSREVVVALIPIVTKKIHASRQHF